MKLLPSAFVALRQLVIAKFYKKNIGQCWHGFRLLAVDGSSARLDGVGNDCRDFFDPGGQEDGRCGLARVSVCYDLLNRIPIDVTIAPCVVGERSLAVGHLDYCGDDDLLLMDRGYPCFWMIREVIDRELKFCARLPAKTWTSILADFMNSSRVEGILTIKPSAFMRKECYDRELSVEPMELRAIKVRLETGEVEVLLTNLMDSEKWPASDFEELYHQRWAIEEGYKLDKSRLEFERWSGKSVRAVEQDFYGRMLLATLSACLASEAEPLVAAKTEKCAHRYQVNQTRTLSTLRDHIVSLLLSTRFRARLNKLIPKLVESPSVVRPGRTYPRRRGRAPGRFHMAYKPIA